MASYAIHGALAPVNAESSAPVAELAVATDAHVYFVSTASFTRPDVDDDLSPTLEQCSLSAIGEGMRAYDITKRMGENVFPLHLEELRCEGYSGPILSSNVSCLRAIPGGREPG